MSKILSVTALALTLGLGGAAPAGAKKGAQPQESMKAGGIIEGWPEASKRAAAEMIRKYGEPDEATDRSLVWNDKGEFQRIVVQSNPVPHDFPMPHEDVLTQAIRYDVPPEKLADLARFDGSLIVDRTAGVLASRCDREASNLLALNLAREIVEGKRHVEDARRFFAETLAERLAGRQSEYDTKLLFEAKGSGFKDEVILQPGGSPPTEQDAR